MGVIRLTIVTAAAIYGAMWWYGRDEGLPEDRLGRDPEPVAASQPADAAPEASTVEVAEETAETPAQPPETAAAPPEPEPAPVDEVPPEAEPAPVPDTQSAENAMDDSAPVASPLVAEEAPALTPWVVTGAARVNLRAGPSTDYGIVGALTQGTRVEEMGEAIGGWRQIRVPATGEEGFMFQTYLAAP